MKKNLFAFLAVCEGNIPLTDWLPHIGGALAVVATDDGVAAAAAAGADDGDDGDDNDGDVKNNLNHRLLFTCSIASRPNRKYW